MSDTKTYIVPDQGNNNLATMAMMNGGGGFGGGSWNNPFMYLVWMWMMRWMNGENGNNDPAVQRQLQTLQEQMNDNHTSDLLMQGINGNADAIRSLSDRLSCDTNVLQQAVNGVATSIGQVGSQLGFSSERIINAVNQGDCGVIQALKDCCCNTQKAILEQGYQSQLANERQTFQLSNHINNVHNALDKGFATSAYETQAQTCALQNTIRDSGTSNTNQIIAKLDALQNQALLDKIDNLREKNSEQAVIINNGQQSAMFGQMIQAATAPINATLAGLTKDFAEIQCKLPNTVTLPYSCATAVPTSAVYGFCNGGYYGNNAWG